MCENLVLAFVGSVELVDSWFCNIFYVADSYLNGGVKEEILSILSNFGGLNSGEIKDHLPTVSKRTIERSIKELKDDNKIKFRGAPKTGGYYLIDINN